MVDETIEEMDSLLQTGRQERADQRQRAAASASASAAAAAATAAAAAAVGSAGLGQFSDEADDGSCPGRGHVSQSVVRSASLCCSGGG